MGVIVEEEGVRLRCSAPLGLRGAHITLPFPSVGATENVIIAAATASGTTVLHGGAREPEIADLVAYLRGCGAQITTELDGAVIIDGVPTLSGCTHSIMPDRIAAGTYLAAAAITGGQIELTDVRPAHLLSTLAVLSNAGCTVSTSIDRVTLSAPRRLRELGTIKTGPYPGFPTDMQAIMMAVATRCDGNTLFVENIFDSRYKHVPQLNRLGARIICQGRIAVVCGVEELCGRAVRCTDLRGGAAAVVVALAAAGETTLTDLHHLERGYEQMDDNLRHLGARITKG